MQVACRCIDRGRKGDPFQCAISNFHFPSKEPATGDSLHFCFGSVHFYECAELPINVPVYHRKAPSSVSAALWSSSTQSCAQFGVGREREDMCSAVCHLKTPWMFLGLF